MSFCRQSTDLGMEAPSHHGHAGGMLHPTCRGVRKLSWQVLTCRVSMRCLHRDDLIANRLSREYVKFCQCCKET